MTLHDAFVHDTFLQPILDSPEADEPRLRLAEWLDERCNPLGEFIRVQCRLARSDEPRACQFELEMREQELLNEFDTQWAGELAGLVDYWVFHRGFVEEVGLSVDGFLAHAETLLSLAPLQQVHINGLGPRLTALAACPFLAKVRFLDFSGNRLGDPGLLLLAESPFLAGALGLNLTHCRIGDAGALALSFSPHTANLSELYLDCNNITDAGACALAAARHLGGLACFFIAFNNLSRVGQQRLLARFGPRVRLGFPERRRSRLTGSESCPSGNASPATVR